MFLIQEMQAGQSYVRDLGTAGAGDIRIHRVMIDAGPWRGYIDYPIAGDNHVIVFLAPITREEGELIQGLSTMRQGSERRRILEME